MTRWILAAAAAGITALAGCATPDADSQQPTTAASSQRCVPLTGSNVCRRDGPNTSTSNVKGVSGDEVRRQGGEMVRPTGTVPTN